MKKKIFLLMPGFIKQAFIVMVLYFGESLATKCLSLNNHLCTSRPALIDLNPDELNYYPLMASLDRCDGGCNTEGPFSKTYVPNKIEDVNLEGFSIMKGINESNIFLVNADVDLIVEHVI